MPLFNTVSKTIPGDSYGYSHVRTENLESTEFTLATIVVDASGSTTPFSSNIEDALREIVKACALHPRSDSMMIRTVAFGHTVREIHGFVPVADIDTSVYTQALQPMGNTALYDAVQNSVSAATAFAADLKSKDFEVNGITFILTDGEDNASRAASPATVKRTLMDIHLKESMITHNTILFGINDADAHFQGVLQNVSNECGFNGYLSLGAANANTIAKLGKFISKSVGVASTSLASNNQQAPQAISLTF